MLPKENQISRLGHPTPLGRPPPSPPVGTMSQRWDDFVMASLKDNPCWEKSNGGDSAGYWKKIQEDMRKEKYDE